MGKDKKYRIDDANANTAVDKDILLTIYEHLEEKDNNRSTSSLPPWFPKESDMKTTTKRPYQIAWTPYTTPTPLPNRPDWNATDWKNYFKGNHPNFWFKEKLRKESLAKREKDKLVEFLQKQEKQKNQTE